MAVPKTQRSIPKCIALVKAKELIKYTIEITNNEKTFKPAYKALTEDIIHCAEKIFIDSFSANNVYVTSSDKMHMRLKYQRTAINECKNLIALIDMAFSFNHLDSKRVKYWTNKVIETQEIIKAWNKADTERYKQFK